MLVVLAISYCAEFLFKELQLLQFCLQGPPGIGGDLGDPGPVGDKGARGMKGESGDPVRFSDILLPVDSGRN